MNKAGWSSILVAAMLLAVCVSAEAQQPKKIPRIGFLSPTSPSVSPARIEAFRQGLRDLGYVEGKNIVVEYRYAGGKVDRFPDLAADLVRSKVAIIVARSGVGARAAKNATKTIPIIMVGVGSDPVDAGLLESFARPGGNITGFTDFGVETAGKRLELFKETVPKAVRIAVFYDPTNRDNSLAIKEVQIAARPLGVTVQLWEVRGTDGFEKVFAALNKEPPDGLFLIGGPLMRANEKRTASFALANRLPSIYNSREAVEAGALMSYAADPMAPFRRAATYVDKILKGAKPADLPVEQPTKFEFVINLKTAKQIGLTIPPNVLARADKVIR
jgi:putative tryptophan/tyrosine transport system substrate-binding protein